MSEAMSSGKKYFYLKCIIFAPVMVINEKYCIFFQIKKINETPLVSAVIIFALQILTTITPETSGVFCFVHEVFNGEA